MIRPTHRFVLRMTLAFFCAVMSVNASAQVVCPDPPNRVSVTVDADVTFDPTTQLYMYQYTVRSNPGSQQDVNRFALDFAPPVSDILKPQGWSVGPFADRNALLWGATESVEEPPDAPDTGNIPPPKFPIKPGEAMSGFGFKSPHPPGPVNFYVTGYTPLPSAPSEEEAELLLEECPHIAGDFFALAARGVTEGPVSFVRVEIDIKPGSAPNVINLRAKGVIPVAILTTPTFDATTVDPFSVWFGPGEAREIHQTSHHEDVDGDGDQDLVLHFDTQKAGIRCGDTTASLTGKTSSGQNIQGTDAIVTVGCK